MKLLVVLLVLCVMGCSHSDPGQSEQRSGHHYMQGIKDGKRLEVNCVGRGDFYECVDSNGRSWRTKEKLVYNEVFDSSDVGGDGQDWTPTIQTTPYSEMGLDQ